MQRYFVIVAACAALVGCADPMGQVPRLNQVELAEGEAQPNVVDAGAPVVPELMEEERPRGGLLGLLSRKADEAKSEVEDTVEMSGTALPENAGDRVDGEDASVVAEAVENTGAEAIPEEKPKSLFALLAGANKPQAETDAGKQVAALAPEVKNDAPEQSTAVTSKEPEDTKPKGLAGLFGGGASKPSSKPKRNARGPKPGAPDYQKVSLGMSLPYGQMARVCDAPRAKMGKKVEGYPARGSSVTLLDSNPGSTGPRNFYLTGFDDGCARQFTGALVMLGSPEEYEAIAFGAPSKTLPKGKTDTAYRTLRSKVCRVSENKPCKQMSKLNRSTVFVTVYERFGSNPRWKNILLHDGEVVAMDVKG